MEIAARAGEFDTFLFIRGEQPLLDHIKKAWSGLWSERAIHNRLVLGVSSDPVGGGVIIQRNAWSRVSGVLQTVNRRLEGPPFQERGAASDPSDGTARFENRVA